MFHPEATDIKENRVTAIAGLFGGFLYSGSSSTAVKAYLNMLVFDQDFNFVGVGGFDRADQTSGYQSFSISATINQGGYVYVYLSNESTANFEVYFDNLNITHTKGAILQEDHYYPFGANISALSSSAPLSKPNLYKLSGNEEQADFDFNTYDFNARFYDPILGRFMQIDPMADERNWLTPYNYVQNNPLLNIDPTGLVDSTYVQQKDGSFITSYNGTKQDVYHFTDGGTLYLGDDPTVQSSYISPDDKKAMAKGLVEYANKTDGERIGEGLQVIGDVTAAAGLIAAPFTAGASLTLTGIGEGVSIAGALIENVSKFSNEGATTENVVDASLDVAFKLLTPLATDRIIRGTKLDDVGKKIIKAQINKLVMGSEIIVDQQIKSGRKND
ncbi:RHS repeat-associated core domain-containing protein [Roseivirga echinicomitans]